MPTDKIRVECVDCGKWFLPKGLAPHRGIKHPRSRELRDGIYELIDTGFTIGMLQMLHNGIERALEQEQLRQGRRN